MLESEATPGDLVKFQTAHELTRETCSVSRAMAHGHWTSSVAWHYTEMARRGAGATSSRMRANGTGTS